MTRMLLSAVTLIVGTASAQEMSELTALINDYRSASQSCERKRAAPAGPLAPQVFGTPR